MVRIIASCLILFLSFQLSFGKSVDENTAKNIGYNFCKSQGVAVSAAELSLAYVASSTINGALVNDFYVFNTGSKGFVIVSADDNVVPVLAYSTESTFRAGYIPANISGWLNNYSNQINYVIKNNIAAPVNTRQQWNNLLQVQAKAESKTTGSVVAPLMKTNWNQEPYYNYLCPFDYSASANAVTGCVATAMAQVMKYWNWPRRGVGSNSYYCGGYGLLSADFGATVYLWDSMPNYISSNNLAIGTLMYQAGVSVDMSYGVGGSSAQVMNSGNPVVNCTQNALPNYFSYKSSLKGLFKDNYNDSDWVHLLQAELDVKRPVIYSGYGDSGGHCFVADGYVTYDRFHINWGWGGYANGYYIVEALSPGTTSFNNGQTVIIGIEPDSSIIAGVKEVAADNALQIYPNPATNVVNIDLNGLKTTQIRILDAEGRVMIVKKPTANTTIETIAVNALADGMYFAELQTADGIITKKIVIAR